MNWLREHRRSALVCGITILLPTLLYLYALAQFAGLAAAYRGEANRLEPRIARFQGLIENEALIRESAAVADRRAARLTFAAAVDAGTAGTGLQKELRQAFSDAGLSVSNSQILPVRKDGDFDYVGLRFTVTGDINGLDEAMAAVAGFEPRLFFESIDITPQRSRRGRDAGQQVTATMQLYALRALL